MVSYKRVGSKLNSSKRYLWIIILTNYLESVVKADMHHIPFKDKPFDNVFVGEMITS